MSDPKDTSMPCRQAETLLTQELFGELDAAAQASLRLHLAACSECRGRLQDMRGALGLVSAAMAAEPAPKLDPVQRNALLDQVTRRPPRVLVLRLPVRSLALAASLAVVGLTVWAAMMIVPRARPAAPAVALLDVPRERAQPSAGGWAKLPAADEAPSLAPREAAGSRSRDDEAAEAQLGALPAATAAARTARPAAESLAADAAAPLKAESPAVMLPPSHLFREIPIGLPVIAADEPSVALALTASTGSVELAQRYLHAGFLPPPGAVRTEEFLNFTAPPSPGSSDPLAVRTAEGLSPFKDANLMVIAIATMRPVRDVQLRIDLPPWIERYRLLGYEDRMLAEGENAMMGVEWPAGGTAVVLVEYWQRAGGSDLRAVAPTVTVRYADVQEGGRREVRHHLSARQTMDDAAHRLELSAAAGAFAESLRGGAIELSAIEGLFARLVESRPQDATARELLEMVRLARSASPAP